MNFDLTRVVATRMNRLMYIGALAAWTTIGVYAYKFAPGHWFELSTDDGRWANFATFYGGVLGPAFSFFGFIAVAWTVSLQTRQLDDVRRRATLDEYQRTLSGLAARIDAMLSQAPRSHADSFRALNVTPLSLWDLISAIGTWCLSKPALAEADWMRWAASGEDLARLKEVAARELVVLGLEVETLAWALGQYELQGGSGEVAEFYRYRYRAVLCWLDAMGLLESHGQVQKVFRPKDSRRFMVPDLVASS